MVQHRTVGEARPHTSRQRVTVAQASEILGVTVEAVRGRIKRGTLEHERHSGTVYVLLDADQSTNRTRPGVDQTVDRLQSDGAALISEMRERIASLEHQLTEERKANSEHRRLLAAALERIPPQLEAPQETRESPQTVEEEPERAEPRPAKVESQEGVRSPWWRRMFGG